MDPEIIDFKRIPLVALRQKSRQLISRLLNPIKILPSEEGYPRDWRGIAYLVGIQNINSTSIIFNNNNDEDPMSKILKIWCNDHKITATFDNLRKFIGIIDRWDVNDDISDILDEDAKEYLKRPEKKDKQNDTIADMSLKSSSEDTANHIDNNVITKDDVMRAQNGLSSQFYDAFVLFADEDVEFAIELIEKMENYGFKLCVRERDLIGGISFEHEAILRLISERCNRLIVIVSPAFLKSRANAFFVNFAQALGIEQGRRKIVPCLYERCTLPPTLSFYFLLNYQRSSKLWNFWEKLKESIQNTPIELNLIRNNSALCNKTTVLSTLPTIQITEATSTSQNDDIDSSEDISKYNRNIRNKKSIDNTNLQSEFISNNKSLTKNMQLQSNSEFNTRVQSLTNLNSFQQHQQQNQQNFLYSADKTKSSLDVSQLKILQQQSLKQSLTKSTKWYKKFLSVNSIFDNNSYNKSNHESNQENTSLSYKKTIKVAATTSITSSGKKKSKKNWLKKKLTNAINS